jgi:hypothetical protein
VDSYRCVIPKCTNKTNWLVRWCNYEVDVVLCETHSDMLSERRFFNWTLKARLRVLGVTFGDEVDPMTDEDFMRQCGIKKDGQAKLALAPKPEEPDDPSNAV